MVRSLRQVVDAAGCAEFFSATRAVPHRWARLLRESTRRSTTPRVGVTELLGLDDVAAGFSPITPVTACTTRASGRTGRQQAAFSVSGSQSSQVHTLQRAGTPGDATGLGCTTLGCCAGLRCCVVAVSCCPGGAALLRRGWPALHSCGRGWLGGGATPSRSRARLRLFHAPAAACPSIRTLTRYSE